MLWCNLFFAISITLASAKGCECSGTVLETNVRVNQGERADLPCDLSVPYVYGEKENEIAVVIWFKDGQSIPVYTIDARDGRQSGQLNFARTWYNQEVLGNRAFFSFRTNPAYLSINGVKAADGGSYRCRVDFRISQTRNSIVTLSVI